MKRFSALPLMPTAILLVLLLGACQNGERQPAVLTESRPSYTATIETAMQNMLNGTVVSIGQTAFTRSSEILLERPAALATGRTLSAPIRFRLWWQRGNCLLEQVESGRTETLPGIDCSPL